MAQTIDDLKRMSLEEMLNIEITTVSRVPDRAGNIPAAVHVITRDDIRRSGAITLPEALRLAPGVHVSRIDASRYAIGIRGFADRLARSMLVLIDGRAVYSPLFAGTYWEVQDTMLADIERIEVIRGPGGTLWGANAVNGIINIITRNSRDTEGTLVTGTIGSEFLGPIAVRFGDAPSEQFSYRVYGKAADRDAQYHADGANFDDWQTVQAGFRSDWTDGGTRALTVQGDLYTSRLGQRVVVPTSTSPFSEVRLEDTPLSGGNLLARWRGGSAAKGMFQLQTYYDRTKRDEFVVGEVRNTFDLDFQHQRRFASRHDLVWGVGFRTSTGQISAMAPTVFTPPSRTKSLYSLFVQDSITLVEDRLRLIAGTKAEHNPYSGLEIQPAIRVAWNVTPSNLVVGSVTRAVRTPSRVETDYTTESVTDPAIPAFVRLLPNPGFRAEELVAYEAGYRTYVGGNVYVTFAGFYNSHDDMLSTELSTPFLESEPTPRMILPLTFGNGLRGSSRGFEVTADIRPTPWLRWTAHYSRLQIEMTRKPGSADVSQERRYEGLTPKHEVYLQSSIDVPGNVELDWTMRYVSSLPAGPVPDYATSDVRIAWRLSPQFEVALVGRNLHDRHHLEWAGTPDIRIQRSAYLNLRWYR